MVTLPYRLLPRVAGYLALVGCLTPLVTLPLWLPCLTALPYPKTVLPLPTPLVTRTYTQQRLPEVALM